MTKAKKSFVLTFQILGQNIGQFSYQRGRKGQVSGNGKRNRHFFEGKFSNLGWRLSRRTAVGGASSVLGFLANLGHPPLGPNISWQAFWESKVNFWILETSGEWYQEDSLLNGQDNPETNGTPWYWGLCWLLVVLGQNWVNVKKWPAKVLDLYIFGRPLLKWGTDGRTSSVSILASIFEFPKILREASKSEGRVMLLGWMS